MTIFGRSRRRCLAEAAAGEAAMQGSEVEILFESQLGDSFAWPHMDIHGTDMCIYIYIYDVM